MNTSQQSRSGAGAPRLIVLILIICAVGAAGYFFGNKSQSSAAISQQSPDLTPLKAQLEQAAESTLSSAPLAEEVRLQATAATEESAVRQIHLIADRFNAEVLPSLPDPEERRFLISTTPSRQIPLAEALRKMEDPGEVTLPVTEGTGLVEVILVLKPDPE